MNPNLIINTSTDWNDSDWAEFKTWLLNELHNGKCTITFTKLNGDERVMECTLNELLIGPMPVTENKTPRKKSDNAVPVYDINAKGWRSFVLKNVTKVIINI